MVLGERTLSGYVRASERVAVRSSNADVDDLRRPDFYAALFKLAVEDF